MIIINFNGDIGGAIDRRCKIKSIDIAPSNRIKRSNKGYCNNDFCATFGVRTNQRICLISVKSIRIILVKFRCQTYHYYIFYNKSEQIYTGLLFAEE